MQEKKDGKATIYLSVIIPSYNEAANIKQGVLQQVYDFLKDQPYTWEVLIVDDGSKDDTVSLATAFSENHAGFYVLKEPHRGKGGTVIAGMLAASGEIILFTDMDQATPLGEINKLIPKLRDGYDIAIGSRSGRKGAPLVRKIMAYGFSILRTLILRLPYKDTQCGFKAFKKDASQKIFGKMLIFNQQMSTRGASVTAGFDLEILYIARKQRLKVAEVPVEWHHGGETKVNPIKDSWEGLRDLLKVRINALRGMYRG